MAKKAKKCKRTISRGEFERRIETDLLCCYVMDAQRNLQDVMKSLDHIHLAIDRLTHGQSCDDQLAELSKLFD